MGQSQNDIITILSDRDYMASVKENIVNIKYFKKIKDTPQGVFTTTYSSVTDTPLTL